MRETLSEPNSGSSTGVTAPQSHKPLGTQRSARLGLGYSLPGTVAGMADDKQNSATDVLVKKDQEVNTVNENETRVQVQGSASKRFFSCWKAQLFIIRDDKFGLREACKSFVTLMDLASLTSFLGLSLNPWARTLVFVLSILFTVGSQNQILVITKDLPEGIWWLFHGGRLRWVEFFFLWFVALSQAVILPIFEPEIFLQLASWIALRIIIIGLLRCLRQLGLIELDTLFV